MHTIFVGALFWNSDLLIGSEYRAMYVWLILFIKQTLSIILHDFGSYTYWLLLFGFA